MIVTKLRSYQLIETGCMVDVLHLDTLRFPSVADTQHGTYIMVTTVCGEPTQIVCDHEKWWTSLKFNGLISIYSLHYAQAFKDSTDSR